MRREVLFSQVSLNITVVNGNSLSKYVSKLFVLLQKSVHVIFEDVNKKNTSKVRGKVGTKLEIFGYFRLICHNSALPVVELTKISIYRVITLSYYILPKTGSVYKIVFFSRKRTTTMYIVSIVVIIKKLHATKKITK